MIALKLKQTLQWGSSDITTFTFYTFISKQLTHYKQTSFSSLFAFPTSLQQQWCWFSYKCHCHSLVQALLPTIQYAVNKNSSTLAFIPNGTVKNMLVVALEHWSACSTLFLILQCLPNTLTHATNLRAVTVAKSKSFNTNFKYSCCEDQQLFECISFWIGFPLCRNGSTGYITVVPTFLPCGKWRVCKIWCGTRY